MINKVKSRVDEDDDDAAGNTNNSESKNNSDNNVSGSNDSNDNESDSDSDSESDANAGILSDDYGLTRGDKECMYLKALSINPMNGYEFAVACGDEFVRIYDMRMNDDYRQSNNSGKCDPVTMWCQRVTPPHFSKHRNSLWNQDISTDPFASKTSNSSGSSNESNSNSKPKHNCGNKSINTTFVEYSKGMVIDCLVFLFVYFFFFFLILMCFCGFCARIIFVVIAQSHQV